jgi:hypothetical protein
MADAGTSGSVSSTPSSGGAPQGQVSSNANAQGPVRGEKPQAKENGGQPTKSKSGQKQFSIPADNFVFGDENKAQKETKPQRAPQKQPRTQAEQPPSDERLSHDDLIKALEAEYDPKPQTQSIEDVDDEQGEDAEGTDRQRKRIQNLSNRLKEAGTQTQQMQQYMAQRDQQVQQYLGGVQQQMQQLQTQNARLSAHIEHLMRGQQPQKEADPLDQLAQRFDPRVKQAIDKAIAPMQKELQSYKQKERAAQTQQITQRLNYEADNAVSQVVCEGWSPEAKQTLGHELGTLTMALAYGKNVAPVEAAKMVKTLMGRAAIEILRAKAAASKGKAAEARNIQPPTAATSGNAAARGNAAPNFKAAREAGAKDALDYMFKHDRGPI